MSSRTVLLLFAGLCGFFGLFAHPYVENTDAEVTMHAARAWWLRGDPGLTTDADDASEAERYIATWIASGSGPGMVGRNGRAYVWFPIGHQLLMVPAVALGEQLRKWWPEPERTYAQSLGRDAGLFGEFWWSRLLVGFLPIPFAAGAAVMVLLLAIALGCTQRQALLVAGVATLCTQFWPSATETMSDVPGTFFLLAMAALVFRHHAGSSRAWEPFAAGVAGGWAVLVRYPHAAPVTVLALVLAHAAWRRGRLRDVLLLAAGAFPELVLLLLSDLWRFGSMLETGYSAGANPQWFSYPPWLGIPSMLVAPGKGLLWFSLPVWLAIPAYLRRDALRFPRLPAWLVLAIPIVVFGHTAGWAAGQGWGIRYVTPGVVLFTAVGLACRRPWERRPRWFATIALLGLLVSVGGVLTPYRGQQQLAFVAAQKLWPGAEQVDNNVNFAPRTSPITTHWVYAWLALTGRLERGGSANTVEPLFGVQVPDQQVRLARPHEDVGFRHWWWVFFDHLFGVPALLLVLPWLAVTGALLAPPLCRMIREPAASSSGS